MSGGLSTLAGPLSLDLGPGANSLAISDADDASPGANASVAVTTTTISGLAGPSDLTSIALAATRWSIAALTVVCSTSAAVAEAFTITDLPGPSTFLMGAGNDTVTLHGASHPATIQAGDGNGTVRFGSAGSGLGAIVSAIALDAGQGSDPLTLDDAADPSEDILGIAVGAIGSEPGNSLFGTGGSLRHTALEQVTLNLGKGSDSVTVGATSPGENRQETKAPGKGVGWLRLQAAIENVVGSKFGDRIIGNGLRNVLEGRGGKDALTGVGGNDNIIGGAGVDRIVDSADKNFKLTNKRLSGRGLDRLRSIERATLEGGKSDNKLIASKFKGSVILRGGPGNDALKGGPRADLLVGDDGDDVLTGGKGKDQLVGCPGNDQVFVKDGSVDIVDAGIGWDQAAADTADRTTSVEFQFR